MEREMAIQFGLSLIALVFSLSVFLWMSERRKVPVCRNLPPSPPKLPVIGHLHHIIGSLPHHYPLRDLARKCGPLMYLKFGEIRTVVVSSPEFAKMVLRTHDPACADRPNTVATQIMWYGNTDIVFSPYGHYWRQMRRICASELLSAKNVRSFEYIRTDEASLLIDSIRSTCSRGAPFDLSEKIFMFMNSMTCRATFGKAAMDRAAAFSLLKKAICLAGHFDLADVFPSFKLFNLITWNRFKLLKLRLELDKILDDVIHEHIDHRDSTNTGGFGELGTEDLVDVLLRFKESGQAGISITNDGIKAVIFMSVVAVTIHYGGVWHEIHDVSYQGGQRKTMLVQQDQITFNSFVEQVKRTFVAVQQDQNSYVVRCFIPSPSNDGTSTVVDITNDIGLRFCIDIPVRTFYVTLSHQPPLIENVPMTFTNLLNSQIPLSPQLDVPAVIGGNHGIHIQSICEESSNRSHDFTFNVDNCNNERHSGSLPVSDFADENSEDSIDMMDADRENQSNFYKHPQLLPNSPAHRYIDNERVVDKDVPLTQWIIPGADFQATVPINVQTTVQPYGTDYIFMGATFDSKEKLVIAVGLYHLKNRVELLVKRSNSKYYYVRCKNNKYCSFEMRATSAASANFWRVTHFKAPHTCKTDLRFTQGRCVSSKVIGAYFAPKLLKTGAVLRPSEMVHHLEQEYDFEVHYSVALAGRNHAIKLIYGDADDSFQMLPSYLHMVKECNPGSFVALKTSSSDVFEYAFMSLGCSITGFLNHLRPVVIIDGTHLKGSYKGVLFVATALDGNDQIFPLAVGVGDKENDRSWIWFLTELRKCIGCPHDLIFVSDQHLSIIKAVATVFPDASHGLCYFHLRKNLAKFGTHLLSLFANAAYCYRKDVLDKYMDEILKVSPGAHKRLTEIKPEMWSRSYCPVRRYGFLTSNYAESVNSSLRWARRLPVCTLLECVRTLICKWFAERRGDAMLRINTDRNLSAVATTRVHESVRDAKLMAVETINPNKFCVRSGGKRYMVDLGTTSCSCREFDLMLIPCQHAAAAIIKSGQLPTAYASVYYSSRSLLGAYSKDVNPTPDRDEWVIPPDVKNRVVHAPNNPNQAGRPRLSRIRHHSETSSSSRSCSRCKQRGHNRASCSAYKEPTSTGCSQTRPKRRAKTCSVCSEHGHNKNKCPSLS